MPAIAIVNQKGGVGKTTLTLGLAASAMERGIRTLVVDLDPQGNSSTGLGVWNPEKSVADAIDADREGAIIDVICGSSWQHDIHGAPAVAASSQRLSLTEPQLAADPIGSQDRLQRALTGIEHELVLIDCPPSLGLLTVNGLFAADRALVVTEPGAWSTDGVGRMFQTVTRVASRRPTPLEFAGIVVNRLGRTRDNRYWYEQIRSTYPDHTLPPVHLRAALPEAAAQSMPIHQLIPRPGAAESAAEFDVLLTCVLANGDPNGRI